MSKKVTLLIPHYKTRELTMLCLRLLRKQTDLSQVEVIVLDNGSKDESSEYLKTVEWIKLITLDPQGVEPALSHSMALDEGLKYVTTPYVLSIHTDTFFMTKDWLPFLLKFIEGKPNVAGVGSWKLEEKPLYKNVLKAIERRVQLAWYKLIGKKYHAIEGVGENFKYLRSHCALYRTDYLKKNHLSFAGPDKVAGKGIHRFLTEKGYEMIFLPSEVLSKHVLHVNHATMVLNPELGARNITITKGLKRIQKIVDSLNAKQLLQENSLDNNNSH